MRSTLKCTFRCRITFNYLRINNGKHIINYVRNKSEWPEKDPLKRITRFLTTRKGHMSVHRTKVRLLDQKIIMLLDKCRKLNNEDNPDMFDLHFT